MILHLAKPHWALCHCYCYVVYVFAVVIDEQTVNRGSACDVTTLLGLCMGRRFLFVFVHFHFVSGIGMVHAQRLSQKGEKDMLTKYRCSC